MVSIILILGTQGLMQPSGILRAKVFAVLFTQAVNDHITDPEAPILEDADLQAPQRGGRQFVSSNQ